MAAFSIYWKACYIDELIRADDLGPIKVVYGSYHRSMPSLDMVREGDTIYILTIVGHKLCLVSKLPVERRELAYYYLMRELGKPFGCALPYFAPVDRKVNPWDRKPPVDRPYAYHQIPDCIDATLALSGTHGLPVRIRRLPRRRFLEIEYGWDEEKQLKMRSSTWQGDFLVEWINCALPLLPEAVDILEKEIRSYAKWEAAGFPPNEREFLP